MASGTRANMLAAMQVMCLKGILFLANMPHLEEKECSARCHLL